MLKQDFSKIESAQTDEEIASCFPVMKQLRAHLTDSEAFVQQIKRQMENGYQLAYLHNEKICAVAGFRFLEFLAWGKILYLDDLITDSDSRNHGYGGQLLTWVIDQAKQKKCNQLHLDSGYFQRDDAHRLYLNHGFKIVAHHFAIDDLQRRNSCLKQKPIQQQTQQLY